MTIDDLGGSILLITDLSARCDRALDRAALLAKTHDVPLVALHVIDTPWLTKLTQPAWHSVQLENIERAQARLAASLAHAHVDLHTIVEAGNTLEIIEQTARREQCGLIVSGTARDETLGRIVLGNTVERLARRTTIPLLVVRNRPFDPYCNITVASDFSEGSRQALIAAMAVGDGAVIEVYHAFDQVAGIYDLDQPTVNEQIQALQQKARAFVQATPGLEDAELPIVIEHGAAEQCLPEYAYAQHSELVVLGTRGATGLARTAMGSVAEKLMASLECDVMMVPQVSR